MGDRVVAGLSMDVAKQTAYLIVVGSHARSYGGVLAELRTIDVSRLGWLNPGGHTATQAATRRVWDRKPGYQLRNVASPSSFKTRVRISCGQNFRMCCAVDSYHHH
jgi:hypothetical protein